MKLTRKDFNNLAELLSQTRKRLIERREYEALAQLDFAALSVLCDVLAATNDAFDRRRFMLACGLSDTDIMSVSTLLKPTP